MSASTFQMPASEASVTERVDPGLRALFAELDRRAKKGFDIANKTDLARALETSKQTISQWRRVPVYPVNRVLQIEALIGIKRWQLRADIYQPPAGAALPPARKPPTKRR